MKFFPKSYVDGEIQSIKDARERLRCVDDLFDAGLTSEHPRATLEGIQGMVKNAVMDLDEAVESLERTFCLDGDPRTEEREKRWEEEVRLYRLLRRASEELWGRAFTCGPWQETAEKVRDEFLDRAFQIVGLDQERIEEKIHGKKEPTIELDDLTG
jgi:hypothetical protein